MKIRRINENTISCIISPEDMRENGFEIDDFFERKKEAVNFIRSAVLRAAISENFNLDGELTTMRVSVLPDHSLSLLITREDTQEGISKELRRIAQGIFEAIAARALERERQEEEDPDADPSESLMRSLLAQKSTEHGAQEGGLEDGGESREESIQNEGAQEGPDGLEAKDEAIDGSGSAGSAVATADGSASVSSADGSASGSKAEGKAPGSPAAYGINGKKREAGVSKKHRKDAFMFSFYSVRDAMDCCRLFTGIGPMKSSLYYLKEDDTYFLILRRTASTPPDFDRLVLSANEFGELVTSHEQYIAFVTEHGICIAKDDAVGMLVEAGPAPCDAKEEE